MQNGYKGYFNDTWWVRRKNIYRGKTINKKKFVGRILSAAASLKTFNSLIFNICKHTIGI